MSPEFGDRLVERFWGLLPKRVEPCGSLLVREVFPSGFRDGKDVAVLERGRPGERPFVVAPTGTFEAGQRVEVIRVRTLGPGEWMLGNDDDPLSSDEFFARQWDPQRVGQQLHEKGHRVIDASHVLSDQGGPRRRDSPRRSSGRGAF